MSTQVADRGTHWEVSSVTGPGARRKIPRRPVLVPKGDKDMLRAEIIRQAMAARKKFGVHQKEEVPVV